MTYLQYRVYILSVMFFLYPHKDTLPDSAFGIYQYKKQNQTLENILRNNESIISVELFASKFRRKVMFQAYVLLLHTATIS